MAPAISGGVCDAGVLCGHLRRAGEAGTGAAAPTQREDLRLWMGVKPEAPKLAISIQSIHGAGPEEATDNKLVASTLRMGIGCMFVVHPQRGG
jgi:hypothetical protein